MGKPGDFFIGVIGFFGIIIPGALLLFLHGNDLLLQLEVLLGKLNLNKIPATTLDWIIISLLSYLAGQFLLAIGEYISDQITKKLYEKFFLPETIQYSVAAKKYIRYPIKDTASIDVNETYYYSFSFIRITSPEAILEIESKASEYKMFRSLVVLFLIDILLSLLFLKLTLVRFIFSFSLCILSFLRFRKLINWTYNLTFDYFIQLKQNKLKDDIY
jgi:hypothetical protein